MYTNIETGPSIIRIKKFDLENEKHLAVPPAVLMDELKLIMKNNVLQFGDTYWLQKVGTLMGATPDPPWAIIFFGIHKDAVLAKLGDMLQLYHFFIGGVLGTWLVDPNPAEYHRKWTAFTFLMQDYYGIKWIFEERLKTVNLMNTRISICEYRIVTSPYKK